MSTCATGGGTVRLLAAAIAAGGRVVFDEQAPSWWVLPDPEGNEACVATWMNRD